MRKFAFVKKQIISLAILIACLYNYSNAQSIIHPYGQFCVGQTNVFAYSGPGSASSWYVSNGGTILSNSGGSIQVQWNSPVSNGYVSANYNTGWSSGTAYYSNIYISSSVTPSVSINATSTNICAGTSVIFTATPVNGGSSPTYSWYVNGSYITGGSSNTYTTSSLTNGQQVTCVMYSSASCVTTSSVTSNAITMTVNTPATMSATISGNTSVCQGSGTSFSASVTNGVGSLTYQWKKNGSNTSSDVTGPPPYVLVKNTVSNGDVFNCVVTSNGCADPATSNSLTISIVTPQTFTIGASPSKTSLCPGESVIFTASSGFPTYNYQWSMNGSPVSGATNSTFGTTAVSVAQLQSVAVTASTSASCVNNTTATGNAQNIPFSIYSPPTVSGNLTINAGSSTTLTAAGNTPTFRWYDAANNQIYQGSQYTTPTTLTAGIYTYQVRGVNNDGTCITNPVVVTLTVNFPLVTYTNLYNSGNFTKTIDLTKPVGTVNGVAGTTPGGGVTYSIPIYAPPGTNGIQPSIGIVYNSQSGNGIAGFGWNIAGLSAISRTGKNIYFNSIVAPVTYTSDDAFLFDGVKLNTISGANGANGTIYATEAESFAKVISYTTTSADNPDWFQVTAKDGSLMEFGRTTDSRILTDNGAGVMLWRINKIIDVNGNYIEFKYDNGLRDSRIDEINYTGNVSAVLLPYNKIKFNYLGRSDANTMYDAGGSLTSKALLTSVTVKHDGLLVKTYQLNYGFDNITSLLKEVIEGGSDGTALNSTIFLYGDQPQNLLTQSTISLTGSLDFFAGDFDADGKADLLSATYYYDNNNNKLHSKYEIRNNLTSATPTTLYTNNLPDGNAVKITDKKFMNFLTTDYNGDGRDDAGLASTSCEWVYPGSYMRTLNNMTINYTTSTGYTSGNLPYPIFNSNIYKFIHWFGNFFIPGDFDGDGNQDYILILAKKRTEYDPDPNDYFDFKAFLTSPATGETNKEITNFGFGSNPYGEFYAGTVAAADLIIPIDFDGDGKVEILVIKDQQSYILSIQRTDPSTGYAFATSVPYTTTEVVKNCRIFPGDFNGDRKTDLLVRNTNATWKILYSTGSAFISVPFTFNQSVNITGVYSDDKIVVSDFNGDGKSDILHGYPVFVNGVASSSKFSLYYSLGAFTSFYCEQYDYNSVLGYTDFTVGDFNGDGRSDLVNHICGSCSVDYFSFKAFGQERFLKKVTDGHNTTTAFDYKTLSDKSDPSFYNRTISLDDPSNHNPFNFIQLPIYAVYSVTSPNGIGGTTTTNFSYENAVIHRTAKGFLGFKKITAKNLTIGITSVTENAINTQFATSYTTKQSSTVTSTSELLSESQITTSFIDLTSGLNKRFFEKTDKILDIDYVNGTASESSNTYDSYGNITSNVLKTGTLSGTTVDPLETITTTASYSIHNTPVPAKPDNITVSKIRTGMSSIGSTTGFVYTTAGLVFSKTEFSGLPKAVTTTYSYNGFGNATSITVGATGLNNRVTTFTYDATGRFIILKQLSGTGVSQTENYSIDAAWGKPISQTSSDCLTTTFEYDGYGRLKKTNLPEGYSINSSLNWDIQGENMFYSFTDYPGGNADTKTWFDKLGRETKKQALSFNNQWLTELTTYDAKGNVATKTNSYFSSETPLTTTNAYDVYNRLQSTSNSLNAINYTYTKLAGGKMQVTTQNMASQSTTKISDATGKIASAIDNGGQLDFSYDSWGNQMQVIHGSNVLVTTTYDSYGRQISLVDKNAGTVTYNYDAFGQLTQQTDNNGNNYTMSYDDLGRIINRQGPEGTTTYEYYKDIATGCNNNSISKITDFNGSIKQYTFDNVKRPQTEQVTIDGTNYITQYNYDTYSNLIKTTYPSAVVVNNNYDGNGVLTSVTGGNAASPTTLFTATSMNGFGQYTGYTLGNNKTSENTYYFGTPTHFYTQGVQDLNLSFDYTRGNLLSRQDAIKSITENFQYDALNRLTQTSVNGTVQLNMNYDGNSSFSMGNIASKTDAGNYVYNSNKIHAVNYITNPAGAQVPPANISTTDQLISYTPFLKTSTITEGQYRIEFTYGADYERVKSILKQNSAIIETKYFIGNYEKQVSGGATREIHYVSGSNGLCAIIERENGVNNFYFVYTDHLGSLLTVTDINGNVVAEQNFDAWGRNRNPNTWQYGSVPAVPAWLYRGYTGHEHLQQFALVNMNGRIYDPIQGRMLSPDNYVPNPFSTQGYNRYAYAGNNPLVYFDPDGNIIFTILAAIFFPPLIPLGVAMDVGSITNVMANMDRIRSFGDGLKYYTAGAGGGAAVFYTGPVAGFAIGGALNIAADATVKNPETGKNYLNGSSNFGDFLKSGITGGLSALAGGEAGINYEGKVPKTFFEKLIKGDDPYKYWKYTYSGLKNVLGSYAGGDFDGKNFGEIARGAFGSFAGGFASGYISDIVAPDYNGENIMYGNKILDRHLPYFTGKLLGSVLGNGISNFISTGYFPSLFPVYSDPSNNYRYNYDNLTSSAGDIFIGLALYFKSFKK